MEQRFSTKASIKLLYLHFYSSERACVFVTMAKAGRLFFTARALFIQM